jgi:hypothetical protein
MADEVDKRKTLRLCLSNMIRANRKQRLLMHMALINNLRRQGEGSCVFVMSCLCLLHEEMWSHVFLAYDLAVGILEIPVDGKKFGIPILMPDLKKNFSCNSRNVSVYFKSYSACTSETKCYRGANLPRGETGYRILLHPGRSLPVPAITTSIISGT